MLSSLAVKQRAHELGFDLAGIAPIRLWKDLEFCRRWAERGFNGEMRYLENPKRFDPRLVLPSAKSVICVGLVYNAPLPYSTEVGSASVRSQKSEIRSQVSATAPPHAWISRYAWGRDYHEIMRAKLEQLRAAVKELAPGVETRVFVDTGPVVERAFARFSGIGWMGKNTCIINQEKGSWFFLGVILTSLELAPDLPAPDRCGSCTACLDACPTGALVEPYVMDASRCISYLNIELQRPIADEFRPKIGGNVFGCDICQDVCPWNSSRQLSVLSYQQATFQQWQSSERSHATHPATTKVQQFHPMTVSPIHPTPEGGGVRKHLTTDHGQGTTDDASLSLFNPPLALLASISEDEFRRIFAHSPIKRAKYRGWLRNLCVAMGNSGDGRFAPWLERTARHSDAIVREHAAWALDHLRGK
jgi:epoxyqueuosine reductase